MLRNQKPPFRILLVDDNPNNNISLQQILTSPDRHFLKANSASEAIKIALKTKKIGLIILDVQLSDINGLAAANILKSNILTREISIIFKTPINTEIKHIINNYTHGTIDYLEKPIQIPILQSKVKVFQELYKHQMQLKETLELKTKINAQLERFIAVVARDLKSPLRSVVRLLHSIKEDERMISSKELATHMKLMLEALNHLIQMTSSILEYSRKNNKKQSMEEFGMHELVKEITNLLLQPSYIKAHLDTR